MLDPGPSEPNGLEDFHGPACPTPLPDRGDPSPFPQLLRLAKTGCSLGHSGMGFRVPRLGLSWLGFSWLGLLAAVLHGPGAILVRAAAIGGGSAAVGGGALSSAAL